jgi:3-dehydroquinate dehydratase
MTPPEREDLRTVAEQLRMALQLIISNCKCQYILSLNKLHSYIIIITLKSETLTAASVYLRSEVKLTKYPLIEKNEIKVTD